MTQTITGEARVLPRARQLFLRLKRFDAGRARLEFARVAGLQPRLRQGGDALVQVEHFPGERESSVREQQIGEGHPHVADQIQSALHQPLRRALVFQFGRRHAPGAQPKNFERILGREFERLGSQGDEHRKSRIGQHPRLHEIGAGQAEVSERFLKRRVVPQGQRHRLVLGKPVAELHARRPRDFSGRAVRHGMSAAPLQFVGDGADIIPRADTTGSESGGASECETKYDAREIHGSRVWAGKVTKRFVPPDNRFTRWFGGTVQARPVTPLSREKLMGTDCAAHMERG